MNKEILAEQIARMWWERMDAEDGEDAYVDLIVNGCFPLKRCTKQELLELIEE